MQQHGGAATIDATRHSRRHAAQSLARCSLRLEVGADACDAAFSAQEWRAPPHAGGIPVHLHRHTEEAFYVVDGEIELWLDDHSAVRAAGSYVVVPPGCRHAFGNPGDRPATYLTVVSPSGFERYLAELAHGLRHVTTDEQAAELRQRLGAQYDVIVVGPPPATT
jgi:mannose-6-phosphate isomerase-like protein (cupin superfamily)